MLKEKKKKREPVLKKFLKRVIPVFCIAIIIVFVIDLYYQWSCIYAMRQEEMKYHAENAAAVISGKLTDYASILNNIQSNDGLTGDKLSKERKEDLCKKLNLTDIGLIDADGKDEDGEDVSAEPMYLQAKSLLKAYFGHEEISQETESAEEQTKQLQPGSRKEQIIISVPILKDSHFNGVIFAKMSETIVMDVLNAGLSEECFNIVADNSGKQILNSEQGESVFTDQTELSLDGSSGYGKYQNGSSKQYYYYQQLDIENWYIVSGYDMSSFLVHLTDGIAVKIIFIILILMIIGFVIYRSINAIMKPIHQCAQRMESFADGDMHSEVWIDESTEEMYQLTGATHKLSAELSMMMQDIKDVLGRISNGDLTAVPGNVYKGDFESIKTAISGIIEGFNSILNQLMEASIQVTKGSEQVSDGATSLSASATDQMIMLQKSYVAISKITEYLKEIVRSSEEDDETEGEENVIKMEELKDAMQHISEFSEQIQQIVKMIANISSQTKMLSINASVEAARAGNAGKGFSVVAEEIRSLSSKSREATNDTKKLVINVISAVEHGSTTVQDTVTSVEEIAELINDFRESLIKISGNVEDTAAISQESAAASEQLKEQAISLQEMVEHFTLMTEGEQKNG